MQPALSSVPILLSSLASSLRPTPYCTALQEIVNPDVFWYTSGATTKLPFDITGLVAFELFVMHVRPPFSLSCCMPSGGCLAV